MRVRYSPLALRQLEKIHRYITQYNPRAAKAVVARIEGLCEKLGEFPGMGTKTDQPGVRVLPVVRYPYLIFYLLIDSRH
jgi:plasmid stabilization system protein ParE